MSAPDLTARLAEVRRRIAVAAERSGRPPGDVTLVAVGKTHPADALAEAVAAGATILGENRVQEAAAKKPAVPGALWHLIGPLQRNKAALALATFDVVQTVDRPELVERLTLLLERDWPDRRLRVLLQVDVGDEPQKAGIPPVATADLAREVLACPALVLDGLMAIPPLVDDPERSRPHFRALARLAETLRQRLGHPLPALSIGMSGDFETAIEEGATIVRVGSAIFGARR